MSRKGSSGTDIIQAKRLWAMTSKTIFVLMLCNLLPSMLHEPRRKIVYRFAKKCKIPKVFRRCQHFGRWQIASKILKYSRYKGYVVSQMALTHSKCRKHEKSTEQVHEIGAHSVGDFALLRGLDAKAAAGSDLLPWYVPSYLQSVTR